MAWSDSPWPQRAQTGSCAIKVYRDPASLEKCAVMCRMASNRDATKRSWARTFRLGHPFDGLVLGEEDSDHPPKAGVGRDALPGFLAAEGRTPSENLAVLDRGSDQRHEGKELGGDHRIGHANRMPFRGGKAITR
jgi:hypothetical protein